jgi:hypothetical protein
MFRTFGGIVDMRRQPDIAEAEQQPKVHLRRELRQPLTVLKATNNSGPKTLFGYACNISRSGMLISTINPRARCECEVVWKRTWAKEDRHRPGMGLRFLDLSEEAAAAIEEWVEREARTELRLSSIRPKLAT